LHETLPATENVVRAHGIAASALRVPCAGHAVPAGHGCGAARAAQKNPGAHGTELLAEPGGHATPAPQAFCVALVEPAAHQKPARHGPLHALV